MAYSELIKNFDRIRDYMREFYVFGFKNRDEFDKKSARSYDNERRRVESWLGDYMRFRQTSKGKTVFLSVDSRVTRHNPLFAAWKTKSFTDGDITLHFLLFDVLYDPSVCLTLPQIMYAVDHRLSVFDNPITFDESTVRKKLKEYVGEGLISAVRQGRATLYNRTGTITPDIPDVLDFFSEVAPCGVVGSFLLDKSAPHEGVFCFKHHYITGTLDSGILLSLFDAMHQKREITVTISKKKDESLSTCTLVPLKILISAQNGRQHLMAYVPGYKSHINSFRVDRIVSVEPGEIRNDFELLREELDKTMSYMWGVSTHNRAKEEKQHVEFTVRYRTDEVFIHNRLDREKRCGTVERLDEHTSRFSADVYDAAELIPWIRTFICRISSVSFSDSVLQRKFLDDLDEMYRMYGLEGGEQV